MLNRAWSFVTSVPSRLKSSLLLSVILSVSIGLCLVFSTRPDTQGRLGETIELPAERHASVFFGPYAQMLTETSGPLSIDQAMASAGWAPVGQRYMSFGSVSEPIWLRASIRNTSDAPITVRFDTRRVAFDHMSMYLVGPDGKDIIQFLDYNYAAPFDERPINHRFLIADVDLAPGEMREAYVRFRGLFNSILPLRLASPEAFQQAEKHEVFWSAQFYGTFFAITFLTLLGMPLIGWRTSLSFGFFLITSAATCLAVEGYIDQHLIPTKTEITARLTDSLYFLTAAAILILSRAVFYLRRRAPLIDSALQWTSYTILAVGTFHFLFGIEPRTTFIPIFLLLRGASLILHAVVGVWAVWTGEKGGTAFAASSILVATASIALVVDPTFGYPYGGYPFIMRWLVTVEAMALAIAIVQNVLGIRRERDAAIAADLLATQERLRLSLALTDSQKAYSRAQQKAGQYLRRLQTVSHDILQPLHSLKATLQTSSIRPTADTRKLNEAFEYLESLAKENLHSNRTHTNSAGADVSEEVEAIPISTVIQNVAAMFASDAKAKGVHLITRSADQSTCSLHPVLLMRAISNLVSNSLHHARCDTVEIEFERAAPENLVTVRDNGTGMSQSDLEDRLKFGVRGQHSSGSGLGLAIVQDAAKQMGARFSVQSSEQDGTVSKLIF